MLAAALVPLTMATARAQPAALPGIDAVGELARLNGQALACQETAAAGRAKALMIAHSPKTADYGKVFDEGTQASYLAMARSQGQCPDGAALAAGLDAVAKRLQAALPAAQ